MIIDWAFRIALIESLGLIAVLLVWASRLEGGALLAGFLLGVSIWALGSDLPNWLGPSITRVAMACLATAPITGAIFLHFCWRFLGRTPPRAIVATAYSFAGAGCLVASAFVPGDFSPVAGVGYVPIPNWAGYLATAIWAALSGLGVVLLVQEALATSGQRRRQVSVVAASCAVGLFCMAGYGIVVLRLPLYPWPLVLMPIYPAFLVYGILRYRVFIANSWARRALVWAVLIACGLLAVAGTALLPIESPWLSGAAVAVVCLALMGPVRRLAERIVYPNSSATASDHEQWRRELSRSESLDALVQSATALLSRRMGIPVEVHLGDLPDQTPAIPTINLRRNGETYAATLTGWESAPPGPRYLAEFFCTTIAAAASDVEQQGQRAERERIRQTQARLAELGALSAAVAHDLRNPLNNIKMAAALASPELRGEIGAQVERIARLSDDLLDYAKPWTVSPEVVDVTSKVRQLLKGVDGVELGRGLAEPLSLSIDPFRFDQALTNLINNATGVSAGRPSLVDAEASERGIRILVCDNGPGIPDEIRSRLFEPFASRSPGGTGLGLAIVARIMKAHGGKVEVVERPPWRTCFALEFPR